MTFGVTPAFLDHFGLESEGDLPGIAELRAAGLLDNRPEPGRLANAGTDDEEPEEEAYTGAQGDIFA
jgi:segregation and condensation protein B